MDEEKSVKIAEITYQLILKHGYRKVTMSDVARACNLSRPTIYAAFPNKAAILRFIVEQQIEDCRRKLKTRLPAAKGLREQLNCLCDVWLVEPSAAVIDYENGRDLIANLSIYVPEVQDLYRELEKKVVEFLRPEMKKKSSLSAQDLAQLFVLSIKGIKASTENLVQLRRLIDGAIMMVIASSKK